MEFSVQDNRISLEREGVMVAEVTYPPAGDGVVEINHTFVDGSLRGQGVAGKLMEAVVRQLRADGRKATLTCSYAVGWFEQHPEHADVLSA